MGSYIFRQRLQPLAAKITKTAILSFASLGIASSLLVAVEHQLPQIVRAETINADLALDRRPNETYEALSSRAITEARAAATENLASNRQATNVTVTVVVRDRGQIVPILSLSANRNEGVNSDPRQKIQYFNQARSLLRLDDDLATNDAERVPRRPLSNTIPSSRTPTNSNPGNARGGGERTFSQPGRLIPPTPGQPTNNIPFGQSGTTPTNNIPSGQTPNTGLVPQPSSTTTANPTTLPGTPISPNTVTPTSPGTSLTPVAPTTPSGVTPSQGLTPSSSPLGTGSTSPSGVTTPTTQP